MNNLPRYLTKSRYKIALECPTKLFYTHKKDEYANLHQEDEFLMALAEGGFQVGELAKYYHPGGHDITSLSYEESLEETDALLQQENVIIYEPAILFEDFFIRVDVLVKTANKIDLIEVKAKSFKSKEEFYSDKGYVASSWRPYLYDIAFQNWVTRQAFPDWYITPFLMLTDQNKKTSVDGLNQLFIITKDEKGRKGVKAHPNITNELLGDEILAKVDVSNQVQMIWDGKDIDPIKKTIEDQMDFAERARLYSKYYKDDEKYPVSLGLKCKHCEFKNDIEPELKGGFEGCWESVFTDFDSDEPHVFGIWNFRKAAKLIEQEVIYQKEIYEGKLVHEETSFDITPEMKSIIRWYRTHNVQLNNPYIFPILNGFHDTEKRVFYRINKVRKQVNEQLKLIGEKIGSEVPITTYVWRHTFASVAKNELEADVTLISEMMGHKDLKTTQNYMKQFPDEVKDKITASL